MFLGGKKANKIEEEEIRGRVELMAMRLGKVNWKTM